MIGASEAVKIALGSVSEEFHASRLLEGDEHWFVGIVDENGTVPPGCSPITVDKATGELGGLPSIPYYVLGDEPLPVELERERASVITLPAV